MFFEGFLRKGFFKIKVKHLNLFIHFSMDTNDLKHSRYLRNTVAPLLSQPSLSDGNQRQSSKRKDRTRLDIENFLREHRIRRYITADGDMHSQAGVSRVLKLLERFDKKFGRVRSDFISLKYTFLVLSQNSQKILLPFLSVF